jgi:hypothetical protein
VSIAAQEQEIIRCSLKPQLGLASSLRGKVSALFTDTQGLASWGAMAKSVLEHGGTVTGVTTGFLNAHEGRLREIQELVIGSVEKVSLGCRPFRTPHWITSFHTKNDHEPSHGRYAVLQR